MKLNFYMYTICLLLLIQSALYSLCDEFFFIRHGQTDHNIGKIHNPFENIPLNPTGKQQVFNIAPCIAELPIQEIYFSPLLRTVQTKNIITQFLDVPAIAVPNLEEGPVKSFKHLYQKETIAFHELPEELQQFLQRVNMGLKKVFHCTKNVLIIAHAGVYAAICYLLNIDINKKINNAECVHFYCKNGDWHVRRVA